jgi:hypothetical protein
MPKKKVKPSKNSKTPKTKAKSATAKSKVSAATACAAANTQLVSNYWKQIPGTFSYEYLSTNRSCDVVCHAKRALTERELFDNICALLLLNPQPTKGLKKWEFDAIERPIQTAAAMLRNPTPEWLDKVRKAIAVVPFQQPSRENYDPLCGGVSPRLYTYRPPLPNPNPFPTCPQCAGTRWVCEDHPDVPFECPCCAPGMPCRACNKKVEIVLGPGDFSFGFDACETCEDQRWICAKHKKPWKLPKAGCNCAPGKPCPDCNPKGHMKLGELKVIRAGLN